MNSNLVPSSRTGKPDSRDFYFISLINGQRNLPTYLVAARSCGSSSFCGRRNYASSDSPALSLMTLSRGSFLSASPTPVLATRVLPPSSSSAWPKGPELLLLLIVTPRDGRTRMDSSKHR